MLKTACYFLVGMLVTEVGCRWHFWGIGVGRLVVFTQNVDDENGQICHQHLKFLYKFLHPQNVTNIQLRSSKYITNIIVDMSFANKIYLQQSCLEIIN